MRVTIGLFVVGASWLVLQGCVPTNNSMSILRGEANVETSMISTLNIEAPPRTDDCHLDLILDRSPERPYIVIGRVSALWTGADEQAYSAGDEQIVPQLKARACRAGGHALFRLSTHYQDQWLRLASNPPPSLRDALIRTIRATALVAVYVRRNGSVMPAPENPRRVIRVPSRIVEPVETPSEGQADSFEWDQGIVDPWAVPAP